MTGITTSQNDNERTKFVNDPNGDCAVNTVSKQVDSNNNTTEYIQDNKGRYAVNTIETKEKYSEGNTLSVIKTEVGTTATRIVTPDETGDFLIFHKDDDVTVYLGDESVNLTDYIEIRPGKALELTNMKKGDNNEIYGIVETGTLNVYVVGVIRI